MKLRGKMRLILMLGCLVTAIFIIYRTLGESIYEKEPERPPKWQQLENVNELMDMTQATNHVNKHVVYQADPAMTESWKNDELQHRNKVPQRVPHDWKQAQPISINVDENAGSVRRSPVLPHKLVHLDLKGAPMQFKYYEQLFPLFRKLGVTGLLLEYEDMFPYWGPLRDLAAYNAYSLVDVQNLVNLASKYGFEIMPLVQTFGHMEFVLKHGTFIPLREVSSYPLVVWPTHNVTMILIPMMIDQVMAQHPNVKWLHIGADEVYYLGSCFRCMQKMTDMNWEKEQLFLEHAKAVASYVKSKYGVQPIMWDDMFRQISQESIHASGIWKYVEIMAWRYKKDITSELPPDVWTKYGNLFSGVWIASAFKGATRPAQFITPISHHLENHISWMQIVDRFHSHVPFRGIALTGWQRYDHFAVLCELLPAAIPSLAVNLLFLQTGMLDPGLIANATRILDCVQTISLEVDNNGDVVRCDFPGSRIYEGVQQLYITRQQMDLMMDESYIAGWLSHYNIDARFSSPALLERAVGKLQELQHNLTQLNDNMHVALHEIYDKYTVDEWIYLNVQPHLQKTNELLAAAHSLLQMEVWPRRPLTINRTAAPVLFHDDM